MSPALLAYLSVAFVLAATPGATTAVVVRNTLAGGWRAGLAAAGGAATANSTYATLAAVGLAVVIAQFPMTLRALRLGGGLYLVWLGGRSLIRMFRPRPALAFTAPPRGTSARLEAYREGLMTNLLNPPIITFYLVVVPTFLPPNAGAGEFALLAGLHVVIAFGCHLFWATAFDRIGHRFTSPRARRLLDAATAAAILLLAARVLLSR